jgi:hypothetical protein
VADTIKRSKKEIQDLLKLVSGKEIAPVEETSEEKFSLINDFIICFKIKEGKHRLNTALIYDVYKGWAQNPMTLQAFGRELVKFFTRYKGTYNNYYKLNYTPNKLIKKGIELKDQRDKAE